MRNTNLLTENGVDINKGIEIFGDMETYDEMLKDFLIEVKEKLVNIESYKEKADMDNYAILVHSLKSDSKYFGFDKLAELSYQHELESKNNNIDFVNNNYQELKSEANRIINLINQYLVVNV